MMTAPGGPGRGVPSAVSARFAVLVLVLASSTAAIYGYWWQLPQAALQARVQACLASPAGQPVAQFIQETSATAAASERAAGCVRPASPPLLAWSLAGVAALAVLTLALYWAAPWWTTRGGLLGRRRLESLNPQTRRDLLDRLTRLWAATGPGDPPAFLADWAESRLAARAFGRPGRPSVWLSGALLVRGPDAPVFTDVVLHEFAHLRNRDLQPTYLALAARNAFCAVIPAGYVAAMTAAGTGPVLPDPRTAGTVAVMAALVWLSIWSVSRTRELEANVTAAVLDRRPPGDSGDVPAGQPGARHRDWLRSWRQRWSPALTRQAAVSRNPGLLYRPDALGMFSAGIATAIILSEITPAVFAALLSLVSGGPGMLLALNGPAPIALLLLTFGPAALIAASITAALACSAAWRLEHRARREGTGPRIRHLAGLALPLAAGMVAGVPLSIDNALSGGWGIFDISAGRSLAVLLISAAVLAAVLLALFRWAAEAAAAWFTPVPARSRVIRAAVTLAGAAAFFPPVFAWTLTYGLPLATQARRGPDPGQGRLIGTWPAVAGIDAHLLALGVWDIVPGAALLMALGCVFVASGGQRRAERSRPGMPVRLVLVTGLVAGAVSVLAALIVMLGLHAAIGEPSITRAGGYGLIYLTRTFQLVVASTGALAAAWVARRAGRMALTSAMLTAIIASALAAIFAPRLLVVAVYGWDRVPISPQVVPILYGDAGGLLGGKTVAAAVLAAALACLIPRRPALGPVPPPGGPALAMTRRLAGTLLLGAVLAALALASYDFVTAGFSLL
jgi:hypothetical protein